jgi:hypothetical protein
VGAGRDGCGPGAQGGGGNNVHAVATQEAGAPRNDGIAQSVASAGTLILTLTLTLTIALVFFNDNSNISGINSDTVSVVDILEVALGVSGPCGDNRGGF